MIFRFIAARKAEHSIKTMCRVLGVSRSGFHACRAPSARAREDERLLERIREIHAANRGVYGSPRVHAELVLADGERIARKRASHRGLRVHRDLLQPPPPALHARVPLTGAVRDNKTDRD